MRKGCDLQIHTGKPITIDLSTTLGTAVTSDSKSSKAVKPPPRSARLLRSAFASCSAVPCTFTAESCCPKHRLQLVSSICRPWNSCMRGFTKRKGCCSVAGWLRWEPANDLSAQGNQVKPWSELPLRSCPSHVSAQHMTIQSFSCTARKHNPEGGDGEKLFFHCVTEISCKQGLAQSRGSYTRCSFLQSGYGGWERGV